ncbi:MAG: thermonuclease family protein [Methyloceanibacter sp.]|nr:thermonuclease family protein [Methyloceanibacter sp.]
MTVSSVIDGETLALKDGREVRLLGILAPAAPPNWDGPEPWPFGVRAREALSDMVLGAPVNLRFDARKVDRHGHALAQVFTDGERPPTWVQEALVASGLARVAAQPDLAACLERLLAAEQKARQARRGIWRSLTYQVRPADDARSLGYRRHSYELVEGWVHGIGEGKSRVYINFAEDWRQDFTVVVKRKRLPVLEAAGLDLMRLPGRRIRVRGWIEWWNGPMIEITHPQEIEVLGAPLDAD